MDKGLMIIELRKYNSAKELLIGPQNARSWGWEHNQDMGWRVSVTMVAVHMKETWDGARDKIQGSIHLASNPGIRYDMDPMVLRPEKGTSIKYMKQE